MMRAEAGVEGEVVSSESEKETVEASARTAVVRIFIGLSKKLQWDFYICVILW